MRKINPAYVASINQLVNRCPYFELLSMEIIAIDTGVSQLQIDISRKHLQPFGNVHGGVFASIIDAAAFWSVFLEVQDTSAGVTTVDLKLNYLAPAAEGKLIAKGRRIKIGRTLAYAEAEVRNEQGKLLTHGTSTLMILSGKEWHAGSSLPPKFLDE